jgi:hypothetical protein
MPQPADVERDILRGLLYAIAIVSFGVCVSWFGDPSRTLTVPWLATVIALAGLVCSIRPPRSR